MMWAVFAIVAGAMLAYLVTPLMRDGRARAGYVILVLTIAAALGLYLTYGNPDMPDQPAAPRIAAQLEARSKVTAGIEKLEQSLKDNPDQLSGWILLAQSYQALGQNEKAMAALDEAAKHADGADKAMILRIKEKLQPAE